MIGITLLPMPATAAGVDPPVRLRIQTQMSAPPPATGPQAPAAARAGAGSGLRIAASLPRAAATPSDPPGVGDVYVDEVMDTSPLEDAGSRRLAPEDAGPLGPGRSIHSAEYAVLHERQGGRTRREQGISLGWTRETLDYGFLSAEVGGRIENDKRRFEGDQGASLIRLRQEDFALGDRWLADSTLGDQVATANPLVARSFRFSLPSAYLRGAGVALRDDRQELRVQGGRLGNLTGQRVRAFEAEAGSVGGVGYRRRLAPRLDAGLQAWALSGDPVNADHASVAAALEYRGDGEDSFQLHALQSSGGRLGVWLDGDQRRGAWRHRYGIFRLERGLRWLDDAISNDRQGAYARSDQRAARHTLSFGADLAETNIDGDPQRPGRITGSVFVRGTWLARRDTQVGATLDGRAVRDGRGTAVGDENRTAGSAFVSRSWALGITRLQGDVAFTRGDATRIGEYELSLDHGWLTPTGTNLSTRARAARERGTRGGRDLLSLGALGRIDLDDGLSLNGDTSAALTTSGPQQTRELRLSVGLGWQISPQWRLDLSNEVIHERRRGASSPGVDTDIELFARLRWSEASGSEPAVLGARGDTPGTGRITGTVFIDENRDGRRSPGETPVANALVLLDGRRATARTDEQGRFEFWPVFTGEHELTLFSEELPLPFGLEDEAPLRVTIGPRETRTVDFPLVRLDQ